jgi:hypothetical protein
MRKNMRFASAGVLASVNTAFHPRGLCAFHTGTAFAKSHII